MKKIINSFLHRIKEDSLSKRTDVAERRIEYRPLSEVKTCLVCWVADKRQNEWLQKLGKRFAGVKMDRLCFVAENAKELELKNAVIIRKEDIGFGGKVQHEELLALLEKKHDLLIDLTTAPNVLMDYALNHSYARCKAGMKREGFEADIVVNGVNGQSEFIDQLTEVLTEIKKY